MEKAWVKAIQGEPACVGVVCIKYLVMNMSSRQGTSLKEPIMKMIVFYHGPGSGPGAPSILVGSCPRST